MIYDMVVLFVLTKVFTILPTNAKLSLLLLESLLPGAVAPPPPPAMPVVRGKALSSCERAVQIN